MKRGLNYLDRNTLTRGLTQGWSIQTIAQECRCTPDVITKYMESMDQEEIAKMRSQAPVTDIEQLKADIKRELLAEMRDEARRGPDLEFEEFDDVEAGEESAEAKADEEENAA